MQGHVRACKAEVGDETNKIDCPFAELSQLYRGPENSVPQGVSLGHARANIGDPSARPEARMAHLLAKFGEAAIKWHRSSNGSWRKPMISAKV